MNLAVVWLASNGNNAGLVSTSIPSGTDTVMVQLPTPVIVTHPSPDTTMSVELFFQPSPRTCARNNYANCETKYTYKEDVRRSTVNLC